MVCVPVWGCGVVCAAWCGAVRYLLAFCACVFVCVEWCVSLHVGCGVCVCVFVSC